MCHMGENEDRELLREIISDQEPDKIDAAQHMRALAWRCDNCGYVTNSKIPIKIPARVFNAVAPSSRWSIASRS
jgi:rubrerythrin